MTILSYMRHAFFRQLSALSLIYRGRAICILSSKKVLRLTKTRSLLFVFEIQSTHNARYLSTCEMLKRIIWRTLQDEEILWA